MTGITMRTAAASILWTLAIVGSSCSDQHSSKGDYDQLIEQGYRDLDYVDVIRKKFDSVSFIANYGNQYAAQQWQTVFYVSGWFECVFAQELEIKNGAFQTLGDPVLHINEISKVDGRSLHYARQKILKGEELNRFVESNFDPKKVGLSPSSGRPDPTEDLMRYWHEIYHEK